MNASQWGESNRRDKFLEEFKNSKDDLNAQLTSILNALKWDPDELEQKFNESESLRICPFNPLHRIPEKSYDAHCRSCELAHYGIKSDTKSKLPSSMFFYVDAPSVVSLVDKDPAMAPTIPPPQNIIHVTPNPVSQPPVGYIPTVKQRDAAYVRDLELADRLRAERRVAKREEYGDLDEALERARSFKEGQAQSEKTRAEFLAEQRDYKRRRKSYRAKVTHKTPTEVQREIIEAYMQDFKLLEEIEGEGGKNGGDGGFR